MKGIYTTNNWAKLVSCNSKLAMQISDILNGPDSISMQEVEVALPPAYDSIFSPPTNSPGEPGPSGVGPPNNYGWKN